MRKIHRDIVGPFIFSSDNRLLLGKSNKGGVYKNKFMTPGGVEDGETKREAVIRETFEEVDIDISSFDITQVEGVGTGQSENVLRDTQEKVIVAAAVLRMTNR
jgi:8-oxo-dGTP pyrophosphatase MutT (NUDIX family)